MAEVIPQPNTLCPRCRRRAVDGCASWCAGMPAGSRLVPALVRLPPEQLQELRELARRTRVHQADFLREAVVDLLAKYRGKQEAGRCPTS